jgi:hypothetical protein
MPGPSALASGVLAIFAATAPILANAAEPRWTTTLEPVVMDSKSGTGSTVGLNYSFDGALYDRTLDTDDGGSDQINPDAAVGGMSVRLHGSGTVAASAERNPRNLLETALNAGYRYSTGTLGAILMSGFAKFESDQSFDKKQHVVGAMGTWGKRNLARQNDFLAIDLAYGRVDPKDDAERKAAAGAIGTSSYYRWNLEVLYMIPLGNTMLEMNLREFRERDAPPLIRQNRLDRHELAAIRLSFKNDLFIAYSTGKLPLDRQNDQAIQIGWSYKLK